MIPYFSFKEIELGPITFYTWGTLVALALLTGFFLVLREMRKRGMERETVKDSFGWIILGALVGGRIGYVLQEGDYYFSNPISIFKIWEGGMAFHGGLLGALIVAIAYAWISKITFKRFLEIADVVALFAPLSVAIGRIGCSLINDHAGRETSLPWGIVWPDGIVRHPVAEYLIISVLVLFLLLRFLKPRLEKPGQLFLAFLFLYSLSRFFLDFTRSLHFLADPRYTLGFPEKIFWGLGGLTFAQWLSLFLILGIILVSVITKVGYSNKEEKT